MNILVTANKGGVGCSSIAYLVGMLFPNRQMYSNDPWHIPDDSIVQLSCLDEMPVSDKSAAGCQIFDISMVRNQALAEAVAAIADVVLIPCSNDLKSVEAAISAYHLLADKCKRRIIVINGYRLDKYRDAALYTLYNNKIAPKHVVALQDSRLMTRIFSYGPMWESSVRDGKGMYRLTRTLDIFESVLAGALKQTGVRYG
jgi:hypothetical protein